MQTFTLKELNNLLKSNTHINRVQLKQVENRNRYRYEILFNYAHKQTSIESVLITTRNQPYQLADLNRGLIFIQTYFPTTNRLELLLLQ